jgi:hypothetical protein
LVEGIGVFLGGCYSKEALISFRGIPEANANIRSSEKIWLISMRMTLKSIAEFSYRGRTFPIFSAAVGTLGTAASQPAVVAGILPVSLPRQRLRWLLMLNPLPQWWLMKAFQLRH